MATPTTRDAAPLRVVAYPSSHGFGHLVRLGTVLEAVAARRAIQVEVVGALAPRRLWPASLAAMTSWSGEPTDVGVVQPGDLQVDAEATHVAVAAWLEGFEELCNAEARRVAGADLVVCDASVVGMEAAHRAGVTSVVLANFTWDWIYAEIGLAEAAAVCRRALAGADLLVRAEPAAPMAGPRRTCGAGLVGRRAGTTRYEIRGSLGLEPEERLVCLALRNASGASLALPPPCFGLRYLLPAGVSSDTSGAAAGREDVVVGAGHEFPELVLAADAVVARPGYGILGDVAGAGTPLLWVPRRGFPEDAVLARWLAGWPWARAIDARQAAEGDWLDDVEELLCVERPEPLDVAGGTARAAGAVLALVDRAHQS